MTPLLLVHVSAGTLGIASGGVSMIVPKGKRLHALAGNIFAVAIITMGLTGAAVAVTRWIDSGHAYQVANFLMGLFTAYLAATGWVTGRHTAKEAGWQDWACLAVGALIAASFAAVGAGTAAGALRLQHGLGSPFFFLVGSVASLAVVGDIRLIARRGILGTARLRRHLWRMCTAMLITVLSFFIGQAKVLPVWLAQTHINSVPVLATLVFLIFWLVKTRSRKALAVTDLVTVARR